MTVYLILRSLFADMAYLMKMWVCKLVPSMKSVIALILFYCQMGKNHIIQITEYVLNS